jgi:serine phosphatase RsbU (regulator of sigma subunit)
MISSSQPTVPSLSPISLDGNPKPTDGEPAPASHLLSQVEQADVSPQFSVARAVAPVVQPSGGDFHAVVPIPDGTGDLAVVLGDVAGHGPDKTEQAELLCRTLSDKLQQGTSPGQALSEANAAVEADPAFDDFATVFVGRLEADTGKLTYASGGHEPALVAAAGQEVDELGATGPAVGIVPPKRATYRERDATLPEGGTLVLYSDGVTESRRLGYDHVRFGSHRLSKLLARLARLPLMLLVSKLLRQVIAFCRGQFDDDVSLLAIRRRAEAEAKKQRENLSL